MSEKGKPVDTRNHEEELAAISREGMDLLGRFWRWNQISQFETHFVEKVSGALGCSVTISPNAYGRPDGIVIPVLILRKQIEEWLAKPQSYSVHAENHEGKRL